MTDHGDCWRAASPVVLGRLRNDLPVLLGQCGLIETKGHDIATGALHSRLRYCLCTAGLRMRNRHHQEQQRSADHERCDIEPQDSFRVPATADALLAVPA